MNKKVIVTGAGGFVGAALVKELLKKNYSVHAILRQNSLPSRLSSVEKQITIHGCGLYDSNKLQSVIKKISPDIIFHLATYGAYPGQPDINEMIKTNIQGLYNLLESVRTNNFTQLIITGSSSEYGKKEKPMKETDSIEPNNMYGVTKATATHISQVFAKMHKKSLIVFRLFNVYGEGEEKGRLVRSVIEAALQNNTIKLAMGKEARDFIHVDDVVSACIYAIGEKQFIGEVFNIGTGKQTTILELAKKVVLLTNSKSQIILGAYSGRTWDTFHWKANTYKTKHVLGWKAKETLTQGLIKTIEWYKNELKV